LAKHLRDIDTHIKGLSTLSNLINADVVVRSGSVDDYTIINPVGSSSRLLLGGDITIDAGDTLKINPGVELFFY